MRGPGYLDIAHLGHVELLTSDFEGSRWFFTELLAFREVAEVDGSVFLHAWDDYERYTIKLTRSEKSGVGRMGLRAASPEALERRVAAIEAAGRGTGWVRASRRGRTGAQEPGGPLPRPRRQRAPPRPRELPR